jgi:hypothetical protein
VEYIVFGDQLTIDVSRSVIITIRFTYFIPFFFLSIQQYVIAVAIIFGVVCVLYSNHALSTLSCVLQHDGGYFRVLQQSPETASSSDLACRMCYKHDTIAVILLYSTQT